MDFIRRNKKITIRKAGKKDIPLVSGFIYDLKRYEKKPEETTISEDDLYDLIVRGKSIEVYIAEIDGASVGQAIIYYTFSSSWENPGMYMEDFYIKPEYRDQGIGKAMFRHIARIAVEKNCYGLSWAVLKENKSAIGFYNSIGGQFDTECIQYRLEGDALLNLALSDEKSRN